MNLTYFNSIIKQVESCTTCAELARVSSHASTEISSLQGDITTQLALLAPLIIVPTDLASAITWIKSAINTYVGPQATLIEQQAILVTQLSNILAAVSTQAGKLGCI
jgi:hypothetical protein